MVINISMNFDPEMVPKRALPSGEQIPCIGMGTFGSDRYTREQVSAAVAGGLRCGYRLFDCASVYGNEDLIGKVFEAAIKDGSVGRDELFIMSKVWNDQHGAVQKSCKQSLQDLRLSYIDAYFVHWPFPNYHAPGCDGDARNPDSRPFSAEEFMSTWIQLEKLVDDGFVRYIGMSNMTVPKLEAVLPLCRIKPALIEMELHPCFQQPELFEYCVKKGIQPIGYSPIGSPSRPERDKTDADAVDMEAPEVLKIAEAHDMHPAHICLKWAVQRGQIPIPFSVDENKYKGNLGCIIGDPLSKEEMDALRAADRNCRLIKGQVFLWEGAKGWEDLWDMDGAIAQ